MQGRLKITLAKNADNEYVAEVSVDGETIKYSPAYKTLEEAKSAAKEVMAEVASRTSPSHYIEYDGENLIVNGMIESKTEH